MTQAQQGKIEIHTENIFPIIKKAVYSDHEIFLRELISNSVDAISKRRMAALAGDCKDAENGKIEISIDKEKNTLTITDNGIGMDIEEVKKYINQVAFSSAEEFINRYQNKDEQIIGHFGLGFYSSFMVASNVEIKTKSAKINSKPVHWSCDGSPNYSISDLEKENIGTEVILTLMEDEQEYIEATRIKALITKYCDFMPVDISLDGETINKKNPLWRKSQKEITDQEYIELYNYLYPFQGDPLLWIHLNTDYPYNLQGILYFPKITGRADWEKGEIKLYCNQVFVSESIKEVVPSYLTPLRGVLDSTDIPLNVSRSALQTDRKVRSIGNFISKKIADRLKALKQEKPEFYSEIWESIAPFIKIGAMEDDKFADQVENLILFPTTIKVDNKNNLDVINTKNKSYTTIESYKSRIKDTDQNRVIYCTDEVSQASPLELWKAQGNEVLFADTVIDSQFIPWLETRKTELKFQRVDSELDDSLKEQQPNISDSDGENASDKLKEFIQSTLKDDKVTIQIQSLKGKSTPPAMILLPEQMRRMNDMGALMQQKLPGLPEHHVLIINESHNLVKALKKLNSSSVLLASGEKSPTNKLGEELVKNIYSMAKLGVGGLEPEEIREFQAQSADLMGNLMEKAL